MAEWAMLSERRVGLQWPRQKGTPRPALSFATAFGLLIVLLVLPVPAAADEFDPLIALKEAAPLNERWQACVADYVRLRIQSQQPSSRITENALRRCRMEEGRLRRFLAQRTGRKSAGTVIRLLREKYRSDLIGIINERRRDD
jgi:F0F1-type ATP synthase membrane subunit b/b'